MAKSVTFKLFDTVGWETSNFKKAVSAEVYQGSKKFFEVDLDYSWTKDQKLEAIEVAYINRSFSEYEKEYQKAERERRKLEERLKREQEIEFKRLQREQEKKLQKEKREAQKKAEAEKREVQRKVEAEKRERERQEYLAWKKEEEQRKQQEKEEKEFQKELARLIREDLKKVMKEEHETDETLLLKKEKTVFHTDEEKERIRKAKQELDKERKNLKKNIQGRIRLYLQDRLIDNLHFFDKQKVEDFVKILDRLYGMETRSLKTRADEMNFRKFIDDVTAVLETYDSRVLPTEDQIIRGYLKRQLWEEHTYDKERDFLSDELPTYKRVDERIRYYYKKSTDTNMAVKIYDYEFDAQYELTANSELDLDEAYDILKKLFVKELYNMVSAGELKNGKHFQVRLIIPQYDAMEGLVYEYTGGNGVRKQKNGYGMSVNSETFYVDRISDYVDRLLWFLRQRFASYMNRNHGAIFTQFLTGFMVSVAI